MESSVRLAWDQFVAEALAAAAEIDGTGEVYRADDVHHWLERLARAENAAPPEPLCPDT